MNVKDDDICEDISDENFKGKRLRPWSCSLYIHHRLRSGYYWRFPLQIIK